MSNKLPTVRVERNGVSMVINLTDLDPENDIVLNSDGKPVDAKHAAKIRKNNKVTTDSEQ